MLRAVPEPRRVGAWVRQQLDTRKMSVKAATERSGLSRQTWYGLMSDTYPPSTETQRGVADALEVEPGWYDALLAGREPERVSTDVNAGALTQLRADLAALEETVRELAGMFLERLEVIEGRVGVDPATSVEPPADASDS